MAHEHKVALERIVALCTKSRTFTKRIEKIMDIALEGLGLTANQRAYEITAARQAMLQIERDRISERRIQQEKIDVGQN